MAEKLIHYLSEETIRARVAGIGKEITERYRGTEPVSIGILKGAFVFMADLIRAIEIPLRVEFLHASSYGDGRNSSGSVEILPPFPEELEGRHLLVIEDIIDTGLTIDQIVAFLKEKRPASIAVVSLLVKKGVSGRVDYSGFTIDDDHFVVGYGLDFAGRYRNLSYIARLD